MSVTAANSEFYHAIDSMAIERMDEVWAHEAWVACVHPGWDLLEGWERVRESWLRIFEGGQKMRISPSNVQVRVQGEVALLTCTENITVFAEDSFDTVQALATNVFLLSGGRWLMVHHHASPVPAIVPDQSSDVIQ
jgi:ketosteroid isomerase-like protein